MSIRAMSPEIRRTMAVCAIVVCAAGPAAGQGSTRKDAREIDVPRIAYTRFVLPNGLVAILHEDHSSPVVALNLGYHAGSKDEVPGKRGVAHLFEHAMFGGSAQVAPLE